MEDHLQWTMAIATLALCAIVGVYYVCVRKLNKQEAAREQAPAGATRS